MQIEMNIPMNVISRTGTNMNQMNDDSKSEQSHTNAAATRMIIRMGSWAMVIVNMASAGPNARNAQPKNSGNVILFYDVMCKETDLIKKVLRRRMCQLHWRYYH